MVKIQDILDHRSDCHQNNRLSKYGSIGLATLIWSHYFDKNVWCSFEKHEAYIHAEI